MINKIIARGQTGAEQGGLLAAKFLGIATGGKSPQHFNTEYGEQPSLKDLFGLEELSPLDTPPCLAYNIADTDGTVIFGEIGDPAIRLSRNMCLALNRQFIVLDPFDAAKKRYFRDFIDVYQITELNVTGNRETAVPGITNAVKHFIVNVLTP